jgi:hypothetical protein
MSSRAQRNNLPLVGLRLLRRCIPRNDIFGFMVLEALNILLRHGPSPRPSALRLPPGWFYRPALRRRERTGWVLNPRVPCPSMWCVPCRGHPARAARARPRHEPQPPSTNSRATYTDSGKFLRGLSCRAKRPLPLSCRAKPSGVETSGRESDVAPSQDGPLGRKDSWERPMGLGANARHGSFAARSLHCGLRPPVEMTREAVAASGRNDNESA